tara:strand:+ start:991 stop:1497 length:507 start_codon:yes stop_codon:yes gene_type:complete
MVEEWITLDSQTLASPAPAVTLTFTAKTFIQGILHWVAAGTADLSMQVGVGTIDTSSNYVERSSYNGAAWGAGSANTRFDVGAGGLSTDALSIIYGINIAGKEKLFVEKLCNQGVGGAGSGVVPIRESLVGKYVITAGQIDTMNGRESNSGTDPHLDTDTNFTAFGTD